jgi:peroxiredoxin (alkyl hydroperoxide reductase subunit C)
MPEQCCCIQVGQIVPAFKLDTYEPTRGDFGEISLEAQKAAKKWTILFFYPADFTFVCATEFAALTDWHEEFKKLGAEVVTVSTDTKFVHLAWQRDEKMLEKAAYPMGSDRTGSLARVFGVYDEATGNALRGAFLINPEGRLMNAEINFYNLGRNVEELLRKLRANIHLASNPAEVCPAQWKQEGDKTLKPSAKIVGKIHQEMT